MKPLEGKIAVVAGATRGAGRGIACMLGEAGATVYCTGRSVRGDLASGDQRPETIEETAETVTARGGEGIYARVDHTDAAQVETFFERVRKERGHVDVLVNDIWGGDALTEWGVPFWKLDPSKGRTLLDRAVHAHLLTSRFGAPLMLDHGGLLVEITDGDAVANSYYRGNLTYDLAKISAMRLAFAMSHELRDHDVTAVALSPGFLRSEAMLDHFGVTEARWRDAIAEDPAFAHSESPFLVGKAVVALATDPDVARWSGQALASWTLAKEYELDDVDGRRPDMGGYIEANLDERWGALVEEATTCLRADGARLESDRPSLMLHAIGPDGTDLYHRVLVMELWAQPPSDIVRALVDRFRRARHP